ncbi:hypothetical protein A3K69_02970 [Candidatus Bathyarchaeota archaeon RBG_16_57_9]|nr:MAG: hypothetical protein A3K69_02970 [Candidatus Bathyarchaeota archaeon RBG_16_57_9]OGD54708.1 MAG: hypothetical protein A3K81_05890 [Candidatus Bathyarchaeota archaeon RBG_13_60_20]
MRNVYLGAAVVGTLVPYYFFVSFLLEQGLDVGLMMDQMFGTAISAFFVADVLISALVLITYIAVDGKRHSVRNRWLGVVGTLLVGVSCGLPLYLYLKEASS